tara:strand:- start:295 stop:1944 length:1650 start_codon:yes stop_codon:yes gene_type:complete
VAERINKQSPCSPKYRFLGAIDTVVYRALANGHTAIPINEFNQKLGSLINKNNVDNAVQIALSEPTLCKSSNETAYQGIGVAYIESKTEVSIQRLIKQADFYPSQSRFNQMISEFNLLVNFALTDEQVNLVKNATTQHLTVAQGVSGSGKSTALSAIKYICNHEERDSYYLALSAVATKRIRKGLIKHKVIREKRKGLVAKTVMEECCFTLRSFINRLTTNRLKLKNNCLIVIDEASMCDLSIISELLHALESHNVHFSLLMIGDVAQVAPVGFGAVFQPLVKERINYVELTSSLRQSTNNPIQDFATLVRTIGHRDTELSEHEMVFKKEPNAHLPPYQSKLTNGVFKLACTDQDIPTTCSKLLMDLGVYQTQIITPFSTYKQFVSVDEVNEACILTINPEGRKTFGFRQGDKVIVTRNSEELGIYNGDMGIVQRIVHEYDHSKKLIKKLICNFNETLIELDEKQVAQVGLNHSYAVTIHKAQGSEFKHTIVVIPSWDSPLIENSLIYTALTRSIETTIFVGNSLAIDRAIKRQPSYKNLVLGFDITHI